MKKSEIRNLSDKELYELSMQKNKRGMYTKDANEAMKVRRERSGHWSGVSRKAPSFDRQEDMYQGYNVR